MRKLAIAVVLACIAHSPGRRLRGSFEQLLAEHGLLSHDIQNPLRAIALMLRVLDRSAAFSALRSPSLALNVRTPGLKMNVGTLDPKSWEIQTMPTSDYRSGSYQELIDGMMECTKQSENVVPLLEKLMTHDFFSLYPFDLMASCRYMPTEETPCELDRCEVEPVDDVPSNLAMRDEKEYVFQLDGWVVEDPPSDFTEYYDLREHVEQNTGYNGSRIWRFIHNRIAFQRNLEARENGWKRDFNRAVSGMHAAVDAQILADIGLNDEGLSEYHRRIRDEPGCVGNLYFTYMLLLDVIETMRGRLDNCNYLGDDECAPIMQALTGSELLQSDIIKRPADKIRAHAQLPTVQIWKARLRMRNLFAIMDCVQCNLCRLHAKVMVLGLASAFQVLLGSTGSGTDPEALDRKQVAALVATATKLGKACAIIERFRELDGDDTSKPFGVVRNTGDEAASLDAEDDDDE